MTDIGSKSKTFVPGEGLPEPRMDAPLKEDIAAIKVTIQIWYGTSRDCKTHLLVLESIILCQLWNFQYSKHLLIRLPPRTIGTGHKSQCFF